MQALAIDPSTPATVYAGTNGGVFKSANGGTSWTAVLTSTEVLALAIDPSTPATLYAGTFGGVFKTTNGGDSWTAVNSGLTNTTLDSPLAIDPSTPATLYAGASGSGGVFKSTDGGMIWTNVGSFSTGLTVTQVLALAIDPSTPATLYAGTGNFFSLGGGIFKSINGGTSWTSVGNVSTGLPATPVLALAIDPSTPATLYAGTGNSVLLGLQTGGIFKSANGGTTWTAASSGLTDTNVFALAIDPSTPATLYAGTYDGVFKGTNGGTSWTAVNFGFANPQVLALAIDPSTPTTLYAGSRMAASSRAPTAERVGPA